MSGIWISPSMRSSCRPASRQMYTGPQGSAMARCQPRRIASGMAAMLDGWCSHLVKSRTMPPWLLAVWIQSIQGRRRVESIGPVPPKISTGWRSTKALKMPMLPCIRPTLLCRLAAIPRPATLA